MRAKKIIVLVGETGSGKDVFCQYIKKISAKPVFCFRFSDPLTEALKIFFERIKKEDQQWLAIALRQRFGNNILGKAMKKKAGEIKRGIVILNGTRAFEECQMLKKIGAKVIYITADPKIRWQRVKSRGEKKDDLVPYKKFLKMEKAITETLIPKIGQKADFKIENNGSRQSFYKKIKKIIKRL